MNRGIAATWIAIASRRLVFLGLLAMIAPPAQATALLYGVTGDGASSDPESFFSVNPNDASLTLIQALGNGNDGESIAFNPGDGLMYHWSGYLGAGQTMETIDLGNGTVTDVVMNLGGYDPTEVFGSTFDPSSNGFLTSDINGNLAAVSPGGVFSLIGGLPTGGDERGLAFNDGNLYSGDRFSDDLYQINPLTGGQLLSINVVLPLFNVDGIISLSTNPDDGTLYAILKTGAPGASGRRLVTLDPLTGAATDIGALRNGFANIEWASMASVPEPSSLALLGLVLAALGIRRKRPGA